MQNTIINKVLDKLYINRGFDFHEYKLSTLTRRIEKRLRTLALANPEDYIILLEQDEKECDNLLSQLTINVTSFFRDIDTFQFLQRNIIPQLIYQKRQTDHTIRVWSAGCASGEEPYSLAILLKEHLGKKISEFNISIYGTDIDGASINKSIKAIYSRKNVENLTSEQIAKYFEITEKGYHFKPEIRSLVKFTRHDLITGFAYTGFDLIMCRNVLIYFNKKLQEIIFKKFHKSLNLKGILVLGKSEVISREARVLFQCVNRSTKIYRKRELQTGKKSIGEFSTEL